PRDARIMALLLASMGIEDAEPAVLSMLLEFSHRYAANILRDAQIYSEHAHFSTRSGGVNASASSPAVGLEDIMLAVSAKLANSGRGRGAATEKEMLLSLASSLNATPLPPISDTYGIRLPPPQHTLTNIDFSIIP
ncbi:transcription factor TAFII-31, partial [Ceraceosorus guamensis]